MSATSSTTQSWSWRQTPRLRARATHDQRDFSRSTVASDVSPSSGFRFVCYCKDCQAFARFLERTDVLDPAGGTDIFQMPPGRVKLTAGTDAMGACASPECGHANGMHDDRGCVEV